MEFPVGKMCEVMQVSKSSYYKWLQWQPGKRALFNQQLTMEIKQVYKNSKRRYGSPRIAKELQMQGIKASVPLVARLMKKENIRSIIKKRFKQTNDSKHNYPVAENKLMQQFTATEKNETWVSDLTYISTLQGWLYLTTVIDLFDRKVIGWALSDNMYAQDTSVAAFKMALINRPITSEKQLIFHSDRGVQYACNEFTKLLNEHKILCKA